MSLACGAPSDHGGPQAAAEDGATQQGAPASESDGVAPPARTDTESVLVGAGEDQGAAVEASDLVVAAVEGSDGPVVAAFPAPSGTCRVSFPGAAYAASDKVTWDEPSGRFQIEHEVSGRPSSIDDWLLDAGGRPLEQRVADGDLRFMTYDASGATASFGVDAPGNVWSQFNEYDAQGRVVGYARTFLKPDNRDDTETGTLEYEGALLVQTRRQGRIAGHDQDWSIHFEHTSGRVSAVEYAASGHIYSRHVPSYDERGRLERLDIDGAGLIPAVDGITDIRQQWSYDGDGRLIRFEQDGTTINDDPFVDGVPDNQIQFEPACADIAALPGSLYRLPSWSLPDANSQTSF